MDSPNAQRSRGHLEGVVAVRETARARHAVRVFLKSKKLLKDPTLLERLAALEAWPSRLESFASNTSYRNALGPGFRGIETDWKRLREAAALRRDAFHCLAGQISRTLPVHTQKIRESARL